MTILTSSNHPLTERTRAMWRTCISSAFRATLACAIVGCATLYGPASLETQVAFPAFSYVTVILVITNATLGDTLRGCWLAFYATCQSIGPAILSLWLIGPSRLTNVTTALSVALAGFVVVFPESTHLIAKRIALGQIIIVYVVGYINGERTDAVMHPVHVAASTALGVLATVLAMSLPYPKMACIELKQICKQLGENSSMRLKLYIEAFCAEDKTSAFGFISRAKLLTMASTKLHQNINRYQESMKWETLPFKFLAPYYINSGKKLQDIEIALRGMEMTLLPISNRNRNQDSVSLLDEQVKQDLQNSQEHFNLIIKQANSNSILTIPESNADNAVKFLQTLHTIPKTHQDLPFYFFLFCMKLLQTKSIPQNNNSNNPPNRSLETGKPEEKTTSKTKRLDSISFMSEMRKRTRRFLPSIKYSISLGLAVLFGLMYSKKDGYWAPLPVAVSFAMTREATFMISNVKAQGTVLGTVYGVLGCFLFKRFIPRFFTLIPWFIFTGFLSQSRLYSQAGSVSAVIGAVLILGRENFGEPKEFAIARIVETAIGISCSIFIELIFKPTRASSLAKEELSKAFATLNRSVDAVFTLHTGTKPGSTDDQHKNMKNRVNELSKFVKEAEVEPSFWFSPFHTACYKKLISSLTKMTDLLTFGTTAMVFLQQNLDSISLNKLDGDLKLFKESVCSLSKCFEEISSIKSIVVLEKTLTENNVVCDMENMGSSSSDSDSDSDSDSGSGSGSGSGLNFFKVSGFDYEDEMEKILGAYLQQCGDVLGRIDVNVLEDGKELKREVILNLSAFGFCMKSLLMEMREVEDGVRELLQWENPSTNINMYDICCKLHALKKNVS